MMLLFFSLKMMLLSASLRYCIGLHPRNSPQHRLVDPFLRRFLHGSSSTRKMQEEGRNWQQIWAESYDVWVDAPGSATKPVYACPQQTPDDKGTNEWPDKVRQLTLPIFALTAYNPRGQERSLEENQAANLLLEQDLVDLCARDVDGASTWWHGYGHHESASWRESGFVVSTKKESVMQLAQKYEQGGIYQFIFTDDPYIVRRCTLPVLLSDVEADVNLITTAPPPWSNVKV